MKWIKKGLIFSANGQYEWMTSHASIPVSDLIYDDLIKIYFGTRDKLGRSNIGFIEIDINNPQNILRISDKPLFSHGALGTFDDNGIMPSWIVNNEGRKYLYYIGWNPQITVSYRLSIGLAISEDGGVTFNRYSDGPICDRSLEEPYFNTAPCVLIDDGIWKMWYVSCTGWKIINNRPEPQYNVKYAESSDGIHWQKTGKVCIDYDNFTEAIGRPCVYKENGLYKMLYSFRSIINYRTNPKMSYRLGFAESIDGITWIRKDNEVKIHCSETGWDSEMIEYCHPYCKDNLTYLFYNGNGFGKSGFGYAISE